MDEQQQQTTMQKPPLGLRPRFIVVEHRTLEILEAMIRYVQVGYQVPIEWREELNDLLDDDHWHRNEADYAGKKRR